MLWFQVRVQYKSKDDLITPHEHICYNYKLVTFALAEYEISNMLGYMLLQDVI